MWSDVLSNEIEKEYFHTLALRVKASSHLCPPRSLIFRALELVEFNSIKVVILGQDPYHGDGQANGLAFSVNDNSRLPPSLKNIFREIETDVGVKNCVGDLSHWANQGVFLLNSILTVDMNKPASHANFGWETFTDKIISEISLHLSGIVFLLWGAYAASKSHIIDNTKHLVLCSSHPSPLSAHLGFFGCGHFSKTNDYLISHGKLPIDWRTKIC